MSGRRGGHSAEVQEHRLHRRASRLQWFLVAYNLIEGAVAVTAGIMAGSVALLGFGFDSAIEVVADGAGFSLRLCRDAPRGRSICVRQGREILHHHAQAMAQPALRGLRFV